MGLFDYIKLEHDLFGEDKGNTEQTKDFECPYMEEYVITEGGRLCFVDYAVEDRSDQTAERGSIRSLAGCMTHVPTGAMTDLNYHGYLNAGQWRCKFTDGNLVEATLHTDA